MSLGGYMMQAYYFLGHSGFLLEFEKFLIVIDYFTDEAGILEQFSSDQRPIIFLVSHGHQDHFNPEILDKYNTEGVYYILDEHCKVALKELGLELPQANNFAWISKGQEIKLDHVFGEHIFNQLRVIAFGSTDEGSSFLIDWQDDLVFHSGDLNDWDWQDEDSAKMESDFKAIIQEIKEYLGHSSLNLAFFPVDERLEIMALKGPSYFIEEIQPQYFVPMHNFGQDEVQAELAARYEDSEFVKIQEALHPGDRVAIF